MPMVHDRELPQAREAMDTFSCFWSNSKNQQGPVAKDAEAYLAGGGISGIASKAFSLSFLFKKLIKQMRQVFDAGSSE
jgi:hypothetical protein